MKINNPAFLLILFIISMSTLKAQKVYDKINMDANKIQFPANSFENYKSFLYALHKVKNEKTGKLHILHLGDSHIQADYFTARVRDNLKKFTGEEMSDRGFVFPYRIAKTNSPPDYKIDYSGNWVFCYKMTHKDDCRSGLSGITVTTNDSVVELIIQQKENPDLNYAFNKVRVFFNIDECPYQVYLPEQGIYYKSRRDYLLGCVDFELDKYVDTLKIVFSKVNNRLSKPLEIYGMLLENDKFGLQYNAIGYNGATIESFVKSELMIYHLIPMNPNLVIISLGTNDGIYRPFKRSLFYENFEKLILGIRELFPEVPVILTTPNDNRFRGRTNKNNEVIAEVYFQLAEKYNLSVWDFHRIMGGTGSVKLWKNTGMVQKDMLHFTADGYRVQGELLYRAILKSYKEFINDEDTVIMNEE